MSESNWLRDLTLGLIVCGLIFSVGMALTSIEQAPERQGIAVSGTPEKGDSAGEADANRNGRDSAVAGPQLDATRSPVCTSEADCREQDLIEQRRSADAATDALALGRWQLGLAIFAAFILWLTLKEQTSATLAATDQANTAREHLERMETPFLRAVADPRPEDANGWDWLENTIIRFENCGRSYAIITHATVVIDPVWAIKETGYFHPDVDIGGPQGRGGIVPAGGKSLAFVPRGPNDSGTKERLAGEGGVIHGIVRFEDPLGKRWVMGFAFLFIPFQGQYFVLGDWRDTRGNSGNYHQPETKLP